MAERPKIDVNGITWIKLKRWAELNITELREENDDPELSEKETSAIRAKIAMFKELLSVQTVSEPLSEEDNSYLP
jgi:hypothetical protein